MRPRTILASIILMLACGLMLPAWVSAEVVGHITLVEGRVDLLKGGKLPATPVALKDKVESTDVIRTKSLSKAQITFIDNSVITLSPESRLAVDDYRVDAAQQKRTAVLNLLQGLAHVVVNKLFKADEPDFVIKTHTAVTGVRGTDFGIRLQPNASTILNFQGLLQVANISREGSQRDGRASKAPFAFGPPGSPNTVMLKDMQGTTVNRNLDPTSPFTITAEDKKQFDNQMNSGLMSRKKDQGSESDSGSRRGGSSFGAGTAGTATVPNGGAEFITNLGGPDSGLMTTAASSETPSPSVLLVAPAGLTTGTGNGTVTTLNAINVPPLDTSTQTASLAPPVEPSVPPPPVPPPPVPPPPVPPPPVPPPPVEPPATPATYTFTQTGYSSWITSNPTPTSHVTSSTGWTERTGSWPAGTFPTYYTSTSTGDRTFAQGASYPAGTSTGVSTGTLTGTVTGVLGSNLTGTATYTGISSFGQTTNYSGTVVIYPSGEMTFTYANGAISSASRLTSASGTITYVPGAYFTQTLDGAILNTSTSPYNTSSTSTLWGGGYSSGVLAGYYGATLTGTGTAPWLFYYDQFDLSDLTGTIRGVVSPGPSGTQVGALTIFPVDPDTPFASSLITPPTPYLFDRWRDMPIVGSATLTNNQLTSSIYTTDYQDGRFSSGVYNLTQTSQSTPVTPVSATYNFTQSYNGMLGFNVDNLRSISGNITTYGNGWGQRLATGTANTPGTEYLNGYYNAYNQGSWTLVSGSLPSPPFGYGSTVAVTQMAGSASGTLGQTLSGNMTFIGSLLNGTSFSYAGPVTIENGGRTTFNYTGTWAGFPNGDAFSSGTASGTINQWPGYYFNQTMTTTASEAGTYALNTTTGNTGTLSLSGTGGSRSLVYGGSLGGYSGIFNLYSPGGALPESSSGPLYPQTQTMEGVVNDSNLGALSGNATLSINTPSLTLIVPGQISLSPSGVGGVAGGSFFTASPSYVVNSTGSPLQVNVSNQGTLPISTLTQAPLWSFTQTYNGFRVSTGITSNLAMVEGYGWGQRIGTAVGGALALPSSYTGYFVAQDLGTRASAAPLATNWTGVTGTMTGILSGVPGQTLSGQMTFNGTNQLGATFTYTGQATLGADGRLLYNYYGNWINPNETGGTGSGTLVQVPGTYFTESVTGGYQQTSTTGTPNTTTVVSTTPLTGTRTDLGTTINTTASEGSLRTSPTSTFPTGTGSTTVAVEGVVAGPTWDTRWGVASMTPTNTAAGSTSPTTSNTVTGVVTIDTAGTMTGQFVGQVPNSTGSVDTITRNLISVPTDSGLTTSAFTQTATGTINQTPVTGTTGTQATTTTPIPLTGTSSGPISGPINTNLAITSTALQPNTYNNVISPQITANTVGVAAGPAGGVQTGVATTQTTTAGTTSPTILVGKTKVHPATATTPKTLNTTVSGVGPAPGGVGAIHKGTVTVTPKP